MIWYHPEVELSLHQFPQMGRYDLFIWMICLLVECHLDKIPNVVMLGGLLKVCLREEDESYIQMSHRGVGIGHIRMVSPLVQWYLNQNPERWRCYWDCDRQVPITYTNVSSY